MSRHLARAAGLGLAYALLFLAVHPLIATGQKILYWDAVRESWGDMLYGLASLRAGELPLWNPYEKGGYPFLADPQTAVLYPLTWLVWIGAALVSAGPWFVPLLRALLHYAVAGAGMHLLLGRLGAPRAARWLGGAAFILGTRMAKSKDSAGIWTSAWLPLLVLAADALARRPSRRAGALLGVALGLSVLAGYPPDVFRNLLAVAPWFLLALAGATRAATDRRDHLRRTAAALGVALLVAAGLSAPTVVGLASQLPESVRGSITLAETLRSVVTPAFLLQMLSPRAAEPPFGYCFPYMGLAAALLAGVGLLARYEPRRVLAGAAAAVFFLMACGSNAFLLPLLARTLPGFGALRNPEVYLYPMAFFVALLAAWGLGDLLDPERHRRARAIAVIIGAGALVANGAILAGRLAAPHGPGDPLVQSAAVATVLALLTGAALYGLAGARGRAAGVGGWLLVALLVADLGVQARPLYDIHGNPLDLARDAEARALPGVRRAWRLWDDDHVAFRAGPRLRVREMSGRFNTIVSRRFAAFRERGWRSYPLLASANVRYAAGRRAGEIAAQAGPRAARRGAWVVLADALPQAFWTADARVVSRPEEALDTLAGEPPRMRAILEAADLGPTREKVARLGGASPAPRPARVRIFRPNRVVVQFDAPAAGVLVVNEAWERGWRATLDGRPVRILRANYLFRGFLVGPGRHTVEMVYRPTGLLVATAAWAITALSLVAAGLLSWRRRRTAPG